MKKAPFSLVCLSALFFSLFSACSKQEISALNNDSQLKSSPSSSKVTTPAATIFGGGPIYQNRTVTIPELKASGFTEVVVWNIQVKTNGDLNFNGEFPVASNGSYTGGSTYPNFANDMLSLKTGTTSVNRVTFSIGSSNVGDFQNIRDIINAQGTGPTSILYKNFQALKTATGADAIDLDDENCYDSSTMIQLCVMLGNLGYNVALDPYTNATFWTGVATSVNNQRANTIDQVHLQCYSGGSGNSPCSGWNFGTIPVHPGLWDSNYTPSGVQTKITGWKNSCGITGGFMWLYDDFVNNGKAAQYATAIKNGLGTGTSTGVKFYQNSNYGGASTSFIPKGNYTLSQLQSYGFVNDWASSIKIPAGWTVIIYQNDNFGGTSWTLTADNANFITLAGLNDQASSCKIQ
ncbi:Beta/Gamma crystallin [Pseudarcicella hirudinis]|uniref:Beta/Gamma crystallin n=1 Tax=Pseudarcicella hirudinis TaxID=1079859 RepID=A0A1I5Y0M9_9BACT|nr:hypothetical protein [Pseudarcicella hirudinis]SFQ37537.1 Beta/Gamma crystallin [Pseudarcicella hirudinis]